MSDVEDAVILGPKKKVTDTYEIVGIYDYLGKYPRTAVRNLTYLPASAVPEDFEMTNSGNLWAELYEDIFDEVFGANAAAFFPGGVSFQLTSPEAEARFVAESRDDLARLGFEAVMADSGWNNFQAAAAPMRRSSLLNAGIFSALLLVTVCLSDVIYYRMRRKEIAIARALGVPSGRCARQVSIPMLLLGTLGAGAGGLLGWRYTLSHAGGAVFLASRPALSLFQNGAAAVKENPASVPTPQKAPRQAPPAATPAVQPGEAHIHRGGMAQILRFVWRYIARSRLKSALAVLLAAGFTAGLAAIQLSIAGNQEKIDWLYENTPAEAELVQTDTTQALASGGFIRQDTIDALMESGYITDAYLEGDTTGAVIRYENGMEAGQAVYASTENMESKAARAFADEETFLSAAGSGGAAAITYLDGWDGSLFSKEWPERQLPVVLPKGLYEQFCYDTMVGFFCKAFHVCQVAGYYEGDVAGPDGRTDPVLIPLSAYQQMSSRLVYSKAHVTLDPSMNRELEVFTRTLTEVSGRQRGAAALRAVIWDEELRLAVAPLENSVELMQVLYPVTLVLSLLVAAGIAVLFVMTSAKEAAIMRVLGTSRLRSCVMLALQTAFTSAAGLLAALVGILLYAGRTRPALLGISALCAVLYLSAAILGSAASASAITSRNPLELLQVKE